MQKLLSKRAMKYRQVGLHERDLSDGNLVRRMAEEYTFVTRPVILRGDRATAGFFAKRVDELLACSRRYGYSGAGNTFLMDDDWRSPGR